MPQNHQIERHDDDKGPRHVVNSPPTFSFKQNWQSLRVELIYVTNNVSTDVHAYERCPHFSLRAYGALNRDSQFRDWSTQCQCRRFPYFRHPVRLMKILEDNVSSAIADGRRVWQWRCTLRKQTTQCDCRRTCSCCHHLVQRTTRIWFFLQVLIPLNLGVFLSSLSRRCHPSIQALQWAKRLKPELKAAEGLPCYHGHHETIESPWTRFLLLSVYVLGVSCSLAHDSWCLDVPLS